MMRLSGFTSELRIKVRLLSDLTEEEIQRASAEIDYLKAQNKSCQILLSSSVLCIIFPA